jgi:uncharacterized protein (DUF433 family)
MRRSPGVVFVDGPTGRRASVAGSGLDVWEVVATWRSSVEDFERLRQSCSWLTEPQLRAALAYYKRYPQEIDARLRRDAEWTSAGRQRSALCPSSKRLSFQKDLPPVAGIEAT